MATKSKIEWTETTWNPITGCTKLSQGCKNCYAERLSKRLKAMGQARYKNGFQLTLHYDLIGQPLKWTKPRLIFVNSMSDLFHEDVPFEFIQEIFKTMAKCPHHIFQILTKRSERLRNFSKILPWPENVWMGVSIENQYTVNRINDLKQVPSFIRFLSCEPMIGPIHNLKLDNIHWVIVGGESGPGARPMESGWVEDILKQCKNYKTAFFFKQWGGVRKDLTGRVLHGKTYNNLPLLAYKHQYSQVLFNMA